MKQRKAFTIIEVVLVLAIAGLIFLMVFIALPALQRSQRNTRRRQDMARIATAVNDYQSNNNKLPFPETTPNRMNDVNMDFVKKYVDDQCTANKKGAFNNLGTYMNDKEAKIDGVYTGCSDQFTDPDGTPYNLWASKDGFDSSKAIYEKTANTTFDFKDNHHVIIALPKAKCGEENKAESANGANYFALFYLLEGNAVYCVDNQ